MYASFNNFLKSQVKTIVQQVNLNFLVLLGLAAYIRHEKGGLERQAARLHLLINLIPCLPFPPSHTLKALTIRGHSASAEPAPLQTWAQAVQGAIALSVQDSSGAVVGYSPGLALVHSLPPS